MAHRAQPFRTPPIRRHAPGGGDQKRPLRRLGHGIDAAGKDPKHVLRRIFGVRAREPCSPQGMSYQREVKPNHATQTAIARG